MVKIGIDIGGTTIKLGLIENLKLINSVTVPTIKNHIFEAIDNGLKLLLETNKVKLKSIGAIGITLPGPVVNHQVEETANLKLEIKDLKAAIIKKYNIDKVAILNDANAAALGETTLNSNHHKITCFITLGTGVGGGVIYDGKLLDGFSGVGFEIGHLPIGSNYGLKCGCGNEDCLETVASAKGLSNLVKILKPTNSSKITTRSSSKDIFDAAKAGDKFAIKVVDKWAEYLAKGMYMISLTANPSLFIIGGGISKAGSYLINKLKDKYLKVIAFNSLSKVEIKLAQLGNDAGMIGAVKFTEMTYPD
jgi:glucokinase